MSFMGDTDYDHLLLTLTENFNLLADEVQLLSDRKTVLEHKLRFAHEQYHVLALKYAPSGDPDIASILAKLQLPADLRLSAESRTSLVPLPPRKPGNSKQQTAEAIRDGRKASRLIASLKGWNRSDIRNPSASIATSTSNRNSCREISLTTFHEQDFTVPGKKSHLMCPFAPKPHDLSLHLDSSRQASTLATTDHTAVPSMEDNTPHHLADPICAALYAETHVSAPPSASGSNKCPIRFLDQHSPEEVARYFETHKHEIPRSHEVCVKRYQRNEEEIRKLDAKYGNLVSMLQGLGQKHQPMLPVKEDMDEYDEESRPNERVESWAKAVSDEGADPAEIATSPLTEPEDERDGRYERPLKEVRVGESPSRPWGITVPYDLPPAPHDTETELHASPSAPAVGRDLQDEAQASPGRCPFGHGTKMKDADEISVSDRETTPQSRPAGKCPFSQGQNVDPNVLVSKVHPEVTPQESGCGPAYEGQPPPAPPQPAFITQPETSKTVGSPSGPQVLFNGPVFIGYPFDQAMTLMQQWQAGANSTPK